MRCAIPGAGQQDFRETYINIWQACFGVSYFALAICDSPLVRTWLPFLMSNLGRGLWVIFLGALSGTMSWYSSDNVLYILRFFAFYLTLVIGVIYLVFFAMSMCGSGTSQPQAFTSVVVSRPGHAHRTTRQVVRDNEKEVLTKKKRLLLILVFVFVLVRVTAGRIRRGVHRCQCCLNGRITNVNSGQAIEEIGDKRWVLKGSLSSR